MMSVRRVMTGLAAAMAGIGLAFPTAWPGPGGGFARLASGADWIGDGQLSRVHSGRRVRAGGWVKPFDHERGVLRAQYRVIGKRSVIDDRVGAAER